MRQPKKEWTVAEAGQKGGNACKRNQKPRGTRGKRGGDANLQQHGPEGLAKAGRAGGLAKHRARGGGRKVAPPAPLPDGDHPSVSKKLNRLLDCFGETSN